MSAAKARQPREQSAAAPSPFPPIADYAFLSDCHTGALVSPDGGGRLAVRAELRLAERLRQPAGPAGRLLPDRPVRDQPPDRAGVRARHEHPGHDLEDADRLDRGPGRADHGRRGRARTTITPHTRPPADDDADHMLVRTVALPGGHGRGRAGLRAGVRLRADPGRGGRWSTAAGTPPTRTGGRADRSGCRPTSQLGIEGDRVRARHVLHPGERDLLLRCPGREDLASVQRRRGGQRGGWTRPPATGAPGSAGPGCPTTAGASRSSALRWRSRA